MNPYEELANAIILQAVKDYRLTDDERELQEIERFFRSGWFGVLSKVDPEFLIKELRKEKRNDRKKWGQLPASHEKAPARWWN